MGVVDVKWNRGRYLRRYRINGHIDPGGFQARHEVAVKLGYAAWAQRRDLAHSGIRQYRERVVHEVEVDLEGSPPVGNEPRRHSPRGHKEGDVPPLVQERRQLQLDLADDLAPHVERGLCILPAGERQLRPTI